METNAADDTLLRQFAAALIDIKVMHSQVMTLFRDTIEVMLPDTLRLEQGDDITAEGWLSPIHTGITVNINRCLQMLYKISYLHWTL